MAKRLDISRPTAWLFMHKVRKAMKCSETQLMEGKVFVVEFVHGGLENFKKGSSIGSKKKKIVIAFESNGKQGIKRAYFKKIDDYSSESFSKIFETQISTKAKVKTDKCTGYKPLF